MTKTKRQLRAEAVERLRKLEGKAASYADYCKTMVDCPDGFLGQVAVTEIIDLLTDDNANDDSTPESCRQYADQRKQGDYADCESCDSREKLEADMREWWRVGLPGIQEKAENAINYNEAIKWLNRQAAITDRETKLRELYKFEENHREHIRSLEETNRKLNERIAELTAERDKLQEQLLIGWECECRLQAERDELQAKLNYLKAHGVTISEPFCGGYEVYNEKIREVSELQEKVDKLTAERDKLQVRVDYLESRHCDWADPDSLGDGCIIFTLAFL